MQPSTLLFSVFESSLSQVIVDAGPAAHCVTQSTSLADVECIQLDDDDGDSSAQKDEAVNGRPPPKRVR